jgi:hypothetical protein
MYGLQNMYDFVATWATARVAPTGIVSSFDLDFNILTAFKDRVGLAPTGAGCPPYYYYLTLTLTFLTFLTFPLILHPQTYYTIIYGLTALRPNGFRPDGLGPTDQKNGLSAKKNEKKLKFGAFTPIIYSKRVLLPDAAQTAAARRGSPRGGKPGNGRIGTPEQAIRDDALLHK